MLRCAHALWSKSVAIFFSRTGQATSSRHVLPRRMYESIVRCISNSQRSRSPSSARSCILFPKISVVPGQQLSTRSDSLLGIELYPPRCFTHDAWLSTTGGGDLKRIGGALYSTVFCPCRSRGTLLIGRKETKDGRVTSLRPTSPIQISALCHPLLKAAPVTFHAM